MASSVSETRADLIHLDQNRIRDSFFDALGQQLGVGDEHVVAHQLDLRAQRFGEQRASRPNRPRPCRLRAK